MRQVSSSVDLSVVICTHNRSQLLRPALKHLLGQQTGGLAIEIIVIDNNSTDDTAEVVRELIRDTPVEMHYCFEAAQGISHARNAGWRMARSGIVAFTDDDVTVAPDWVAKIAAAFARRPEADCVGGKVLPDWPAPPPSWLTARHWAPLAILDYGETPLTLGHDDPRCLVGANFAIRRGALERLGGFSPAVQRVKDGIGSIEDHEFLLRMWSAGGKAVYEPDVVVVAPIDTVRMQKAYHRKWHQGHGHFHAVMRSPVVEQSSAGRLFDVPAYMYRQCLGDAAAWIGHLVKGRANEAFLHEVRLRFFWGFFNTRRREYLARGLGRAVASRESAAAVQHRNSSGVS
jgi:glycosyltransferase involved in cell wall biosynthesis